VGVCDLDKKPGNYGKILFDLFVFAAEPWLFRLLYE
jgi:hypothetical protein